MDLNKLPDFVEADADKIVAERVAMYEGLTGRTLHPAQVERLLIQAGGYREYLLRLSINSALKQNFVSFATAPALDFLAELVGVTRLPASYSEANILFALDSAHNGVVIAAGTRIQSRDGSATFTTKENKTVAAGVDTANVYAAADTAGTVGNGYLPGTVSVLLDPQPYIISAANSDTTSGGAETESDQALRVRVRLAPSTFSNAGSRGAYEFHAKSASPLITDVAITNPVPGTVQIFPLIAGGIVTPTNILNDVFAACNGEKIRPLTDTVIVTSPGKIDYSLTVDLTVYDTADALAVTAAVQTALEAFTVERSKLLGRDVVVDQIKGKCMVEGVYKANLNGFADLVITETEFAFCTGIIVNVSGTNAG